MLIAEDKSNVDTLESPYFPLRNSRRGKVVAWFCIPTDKQAYCGEDKRILLMQLTSEGRISGKLSLMGKTKDGTSYTKYDQTFQCGKK